MLQRIPNVFKGNDEKELSHFYAIISSFFHLNKELSSNKEAFFFNEFNQL